MKKDADGKNPLDIARAKGSSDVMNVLDARVRGDCICHSTGKCKYLKALLAGDHSDEAVDHVKTFVHPLQACPAGNKCLSFVKFEKRDPAMDTSDKCHVACFFHPRLDPRGGAGQVEVHVDKAKGAVVMAGIPLQKYFTGPGADFGSLEEEIKKRGYGCYFPDMASKAKQKFQHGQHTKVRLAMADIRMRLKETLEKLRHTDVPVLQKMDWLTASFRNEEGTDEVFDFINNLVVDDGLLHNELLALVLYCNCTDLCTDLRGAHRRKDVARFPRWNTHLSRAVAKLFLFDDNNDILRCYYSLMDPEKAPDVEEVSHSIEEQKAQFAVPFYHGLNGISSVVFSEFEFEETPWDTPGDFPDVTSKVKKYPKFVYYGPVSLSSSRNTAISFAGGAGGSVASPAPYGLLFSFQSLLPKASFWDYGHFGQTWVKLVGSSPIGADVKWISDFTEYETLFLDPIFVCLDPRAFDVIHQPGCKIAEFKCTNIEIEGEFPGS